MNEQLGFKIPISKYLRMKIDSLTTKLSGEYLLTSKNCENRARVDNKSL